MSAARRFTVLTTGEVEPGFDETQVALDFVSLINTTPERAVAFIHTEQELVADVDEERALAYQKKLADIGMRIVVVDSEDLAAANEAKAQQQALDSELLSLEAETQPSDEESLGNGANEESIGEINLLPTHTRASDNDDAGAQKESELDSQNDDSDWSDTDLTLPADEPNRQYTDLESHDAESNSLDADLESEIDDLSNAHSGLSTQADEPAQDFSDLNAPVDESTQDFSDLNAPDDEPTQDFSDLSAPVDEPTQDFSDLSASVDESTQDFSDLSAPVDEPTQDFSALSPGAITNQSTAPAQTIQPQSVILDTKEDEEGIIDSIRQVGKTLEDDQSKASTFSFRSRPVRLVILACLAAAVAAFYFITNASNNFSNYISKAASYSYTNTASADMNQLMDVSGMKANIDLFSTSIPDRFNAYLDSKKGNNTALSDKDYQELTELVPNAYNRDALHNTVASWLQKNTFEDDIPILIEAFDRPKVQAFLEMQQTRNRISDEQGFTDFKEALANNPPAGERNRALTRLLDALILDKVDYEVDGDLQRALITTLGVAGPDSDSKASKEKVRNELKAMRDELVYARSDIRRDALHELNWQLEEFSVEDIHTIRNALDDSSVRELKHQMVKGYEEFLKQSTLWLQREL